MQKRAFFVKTPKGQRPRPTMRQARRRIRQLRQERLALGEIVHRLAQEGCPVSAPHVSRQLRADGFPGFRGRRRATPPGEPARNGSEIPAVAEAGVSVWVSTFSTSTKQSASRRRKERFAS